MKGVLFMDIKQTDSEYISHTYSRFPITLVRGNGCILYDETGTEYIDMGAGIAVNTFGAADKEWCFAVESQIHKLAHASNLYYTEPCVKLAEMLCQKTGLKKVFFSNSGAEANECAIKAARRYAFNKYGDEKHSVIITLKNSFHGRTVTTLSATGQDCFHHEFGPFTPGFVYADTENPDSLETLAAAGNVCAIMFEAIQGEGGVIPLSEDFVRAIKRTAEKYSLLLIADEIQCGNGRSGKLCAYMNFDIKPDIVTSAKGLAAGLPLGVTLFGEKVENVYTPGTHGSTFGGNPVCASAALSVLSRIDDKLLNEVTEKGNYIVKELNNSCGIAEITGLGLMLGIKTEKNVKDVINNCMEQGVLVLSAKSKLRLLPPLNIPYDKLEKAVSVIKKACSI